ncbi:MAG: carboxymuconolactone decarboxylase family protein [Methylovirgula sp.]
MPLHAPHVTYQAFTSLAADAYAGLSTLSSAVGASDLDKSLAELVKLRVSQMNGCAFCLQFHLNAARKLGVASAKLDLLAAWRDAGVFSEPEMAALDWAEHLTRLAGDALPEDAFAALRVHFSETEAVFLTVAIGTINAWNRLGVGLRFQPPLPPRQGRRDEDGNNT